MVLLKYSAFIGLLGVLGLKS